MSLLQYSPKDVICSIAGIHTLTAFSDGTFVTIRKHIPPFEVARASDGEIARIYRNDQSYTVEISLAQSSPSNNILSMIQSVDLLTQKATFPMFIKDSSGTTTFLGTTCWISDTPEVSFSTGVEDRVWIFHCTQGVINIGGNDNITNIEELLQTAINSAPLLERLGLV